MDTLAAPPCRWVLGSLEKSGFGLRLLNSFCNPRSVFKSFGEAWQAAKNATYAGHDHPDYVGSRRDWPECCAPSDYAVLYWSRAPTRGRYGFWITGEASATSITVMRAIWANSPKSWNGSCSICRRSWKKAGGSRRNEAKRICVLLGTGGTGRRFCGARFERVSLLGEERGRVRRAVATDGDGSPLAPVLCSEFAMRTWKIHHSNKWCHQHY